MSPPAPSALPLQEGIRRDGFITQAVVLSSQTPPCTALLLQGRCWVEGDYDGRAKGDSRKFGAVPLALVQGSAAWVCWPPSRWGPVEAVLPPGRVIAQGGFSAAGPGLDGMDDDW